MLSFCYLGSNQLMNAKLLVFNYYCQLKQWGRLQRRVGGGSLSGGADHPLSLRIVRLVGTPGYSEVSLSAETHLITNSCFVRLVGTPGYSEVWVLQNIKYNENYNLCIAMCPTKVPLRGTSISRCLPPSCEPRWGSCMVLLMIRLFEPFDLFEVMTWSFATA